MDKLVFIHCGRKGKDAEIVLYGDKTEALKLETNLAKGWHLEDVCSQD